MRTGHASTDVSESAEYMIEQRGLWAEEAVGGRRQSQTAPPDAEPTSFVYFARTPRV